MKRAICALLTLCLLVGVALPVCAVTNQEQLVERCESMRTALIIICILLVILLICCMLALISAAAAKKSKRHKKNPGTIALRVILYVITVLVIAATVFATIRYIQVTKLIDPPVDKPVVEEPEPSEDNPATSQPSETPPESTEPPTEPAPVLPVLSPYHTENTDPAKWNVSWQMQVDGLLAETYQSPDTYNFTWASDYYPLPGVPTFRGDNYRSGATYGTANISQEVLVKNWSRNIGTFNGWPGVGWTGQPLCVQWDDETKAIMNMYPEKKAKEGLVEVIATTLDGYIYFYDLDDGTYTRDPLWIGMNFKGTASLDPRGWPILYAGSGVVYGNKYQRMYAISLIDFTILMETSGYDQFSKRSWYAFDSSPMISAETDTLFWPGESGILYSIKLNTQYDKAAGTLAMQPEILIKTRYTTKHNRTLGYEASAIMVGNYMFVGDNGGMFYCIDLHTMELMWAQFVEDDVNATPVFQWEDGQGYLYIGSSTQYTGHSAYIFKLNATNGEIVWSKKIDNVAYDEDVSGGVLSSPVLGQEGTELEGLIIYSVSKAPSTWKGTLMALNTQTGEVVWERVLGNYAWSSPVSLYTASGKGYIVLGDSGGYLHLMDGATGEELYTENLGSNMEASPVVFGNKLVIGTRGCQVWGIEIK